MTMTTPVREGLRPPVPGLRPQYAIVGLAFVALALLGVAQAANAGGFAWAALTEGRDGRARADRRD